MDEDEQYRKGSFGLILDTGTVELDRRRLEDVTERLEATEENFRYDHFLDPGEAARSDFEPDRWYHVVGSLYNEDREKAEFSNYVRLVVGEDLYPDIDGAVYVTADEDCSGETALAILGSEGVPEILLAEYAGILEADTDNIRVDGRRQTELGQVIETRTERNPEILETAEVVRASD